RPLPFRRVPAGGRPREPLPLHQRHGRGGGAPRRPGAWREPGLLVRTRWRRLAARDGAGERARAARRALHQRPRGQPLLPRARAHAVPARRLLAHDDPAPRPRAADREPLARRDDAAPDGALPARPRRAASPRHLDDPAPRRRAARRPLLRLLPALPAPGLPRAARRDARARVLLDRDDLELVVGLPRGLPAALRGRSRRARADEPRQLGQRDRARARPPRRAGDRRGPPGRLRPAAAAPLGGAPPAPLRVEDPLPARPRGVGDRPARDRVGAGRKQTHSPKARAGRDAIPAHPPRRFSSLRKTFPVYDRAGLPGKGSRSALRVRAGPPLRAHARPRRLAGSTPSLRTPAL